MSSQQLTTHRQYASDQHESVYVIQGWNTSRSVHVILFIRRRNNIGPVNTSRWRSSLRQCAPPTFWVEMTAFIHLTKFRRRHLKIVLLSARVYCYLRTHLSAYVINKGEANQVTWLPGSTNSHLHRTARRGAFRPASRSPARVKCITPPMLMPLN